MYIHPTTGAIKPLFNLSAQERREQWRCAIRQFEKGIPFDSYSDSLAIIQLKDFQLLFTIRPMGTIVVTQLVRCIMQFLLNIHIFCLTAAVCFAREIARLSCAFIRWSARLIFFSESFWVFFFYNISSNDEIDGEQLKGRFLQQYKSV